MGSPEEGERFFAERWPEARAVSDTSQELYAAFGLAPGSLGQVMGPRALLAAVRSLFAGHGGGRPVGDPWMMSGWFLVHAERVLWSQVHEHSGEARRYDELERAWREAGGREPREVAR